jgi:hypothetical protein
MITGDLGLYGERLTVALGFVTLALFVGMGLTCRSFVSLSNKVGLGWLTGSKLYRATSRYHSFFWYGFFVVLFLHMLTGFMHTEIPQAGDPDAGIHLLILIFAGVVFFSVGLTFSNCRTCAGILGVFRGEGLFKGAYGRLYRFHPYFWILLLIGLIGHLTVSYIHVGFWPSVIE